ncbi:hypothetical protein ACSS7Z_09470 [Microbacterium sp. A82]|uniref:hypothetical protein n=1 Tax=Microbacterium sp. A82 TaxID=3450452 RepID=UPI003F38AE43
MKMKKEVQRAADATAWTPMRVVSGWGVRSSHAYMAGFAAVAISFLTWLISRGKGDSKPQSDRWGLFIGEWAPTLFAIGIALKHEEK